MSYHRRYQLNDDRFGLLALTLREKTGLTQTAVANLLGVSERSVRHWEAGTSYPAVPHLKALIALYLRNGAFTIGHERDEAHAFWEQATRRASRRKAIFDDAWFDHVFRLWNDIRPPSINESMQISPSIQTPSLFHQADWGRAPDATSFSGREQELVTLRQWVLDEHCRVVVVLGMGGIGKTTLAIRSAQKMAPRFSFVLWRSLRHAPPFEELVGDCIQMLSDQQQTPFLNSMEKNIERLIDLLRKRRCLLVFDNLETLLQARSLERRYREGYEAYGILIQRIAETLHQSCLLLTSREMLTELEPLTGKHAPIRTLKLAGLGRVASQELLKDQELFGAQEDWEQLVQHYSGNPLALKMAAAAVRDLFGGDIASFAQESPITLYTLQQLLEQQFTRLAPLEQAVMYWLAIERDPVPLETLCADLPSALSRKEVLSSLLSLQRRCLIERGEHGAIFTLQPEVMEYVSERLVEQVCEEIIHARLRLFVTHALMKAQSNDYLRESQVRMLVQPMLKRLLMHFGSKQEVERQLRLLTCLLREQPGTTDGYGGGNLVNLLVCLKGEIRNEDFSALSIRQAYLQGIEAQHASFAGAEITESLFMEPIDSIASMALSPDGKYLAVGSFSGQIRVWQMAERRPIFTFKGHHRITWALAFSPDSTLLASGGYDGDIKLWKIVSKEGGPWQEGQCLRTFQGQERWIRAIAFSPDGLLLATDGSDETVWVLDVQHGTRLHTLLGHTGMIWSIAFSPDGSLLATGAVDGTIRLWDVREGTCLRILHKHLCMVMAVTFHPAGDLLASGGEDGQIHLWEVSSGRCLTTLRLQTTKAASLAFNVGGTLLASGSSNGAVEIWQMRDASGISCLRTLSGHPLWVSAVAFDPNGLLVSTAYGGTVKLWDVEHGRCLGMVQGYSHAVVATAFSPDGKLLASGDDHGNLQIWNVHDGRRLQSFQAHPGRIWSVVFSPDGKTIASGGDDQSVKLWEVSGEDDEGNGRCLRILHGHTTMVWSVAFSPDSRMLASGGFDHTVKLWRIDRQDDAESCKILQGHATAIWSVTFSPDGNLLASGDNDGEIRVWEVESGQCLTTMRNRSGPLGALVFTPDGAALLCGSNDGTVTLWSLKKEGETHNFEILLHPVSLHWARAMTFSQDAMMFATGCDHHSIKIWHTEEGKSLSHLRSLSYQGDQIWAVAFSSDGSLLASGDGDGNLVLWDTKTGACQQVLRSDRPYERMNIRNIKGITQAQRNSLKALGAIEDNDWQ